MKIVPIHELGRAPEQGRIRYGIKTVSANGKIIPRSTLKFRFTSSDLTALEQIAAIYGGEVKKWEKEQYEVMTAANEVAIVLPSEPLSQHYELWKGATCVRRCDGEIAVVPVNTPEGAELHEVSCLCSEAQVLECKVTTRLRVILPEIRFAGVWRLDCKGWYGSQELPSMVSTVEALQGRGMYRAKLALEQRIKTSKKFVVPVLRLDASVNNILEQGTRPSLELNNGS
jgi:hypothetical protein